MPPQFSQPFLPLGFGLELLYTIIIVVFCFMVYFKTREIYELTKHRGVEFFRYAFLFFGLAYASRLLIYMAVMGNLLWFEPFHGPRLMLPVSHLVMAYFSTTAILFLTYSTIWKRFSIEHFLMFCSITSLFVSVIAFISMSPLTVSLIQLVLLAVTLIFSLRVKTNKRNHMRALYFLIALFWLLSLFVIDSPRRHLPFWGDVTLQAISLLVFFAIVYKVYKWAK